MGERLTSLAAVKDWLNVKNNDQDAFLTRLIDAASTFTLGMMNRDSLEAKEYTDNFRGNGKDTTLLRSWPVTTIVSVSTGNTSTFTAANLGFNGLPNGSGYLLGDPRGGPQSLTLAGGSFPYRVFCQVVYRAGFEADETLVITAGDDGHAMSFTPDHLGLWTKDLGVVASDGTAFVKVSSNPTAGQYANDPWGVYEFAEADIGRTVAISYAYAPADLAQGVLEMVGEWYKRKDRIGVLSKTLAGQESVTFDRNAMTAAVSQLLQPYMNVVPI